MSLQIIIFIKKNTTFNTLIEVLWVSNTLVREIVSRNIQGSER
jgi:hypothetical protein